MEKKRERIYIVGETLSLQMLRSEKGVLPICRTAEGLIRLISRESKTKLEYDSIWECKVSEVHEKKLIVLPVKMLVTAAAARFDATEKVKLLCSKPVEKKKKTGSRFAYLKNTKTN